MVNAYLKYYGPALCRITFAAVFIFLYNAHIITGGGALASWLVVVGWRYLDDRLQNYYYLHI